jgi:hypothetical protein
LYQLPGGDFMTDWRKEDVREYWLKTADRIKDGKDSQIVYFKRLALIVATLIKEVAELKHELAELKSAQKSR